jgi:hypothetical protein
MDSVLSDKAKNLKGKVEIMMKAFQPEVSIKKSN